MSDTPIFDQLLAEVRGRRSQQAPGTEPTPDDTAPVDDDPPATPDGGA